MCGVCDVTLTSGASCPTSTTLCIASSIPRAFIRARGSRVVAECATLPSGASYPTSSSASCIASGKASYSVSCVLCCVVWCIIPRALIRARDSHVLWERCFAHVGCVRRRVGRYVIWCVMQPVQCHTYIALCSHTAAYIAPQKMSCRTGVVHIYLALGSGVASHKVFVWWLRHARQRALRH